MPWKSKSEYKRWVKEQQLAREEAAVAVLNTHNKNKKKKVRTKRKTADDLIKEVDFFRDFGVFFVRSPRDWYSKSYNVQKQAYDFANHCFCKYPVPRFMFTVIDGKKFKSGVNHDNTYRRWFLLLGRGDSFAKEVKGDLTKKEAHWFLQGKFKTIPENIWFAKCKARGFTYGNIKNIVTVFRRYNWKDQFWGTVLDFFKKFEDDLNQRLIIDLMDFIRNKRTEDREWSLKGRTIKSVIKHSNQWHRDQQAVKYGKYVEWNGHAIHDWKFKQKINKAYTKVWHVKQITNSKFLYAEGRKMHHCVYGYVGRCVSGEASIFTMTCDDCGITEKHLTIEVNRNKEVVQARGKYNKSPEGMQKTVLEKWMRANNLKNAFYRRWY